MLPPPVVLLDNGYSLPLTKGGNTDKCFCTQQYKYYCGIDLHARKMYIGVLNQLHAVD